MKAREYRNISFSENALYFHLRSGQICYVNAITKHNDNKIKVEFVKYGDRNNKWTVNVEKSDTVKDNNVIRNVVQKVWQNSIVLCTDDYLPVKTQSPTVGDKVVILSSAYSLFYAENQGVEIRPSESPFKVKNLIHGEDIASVVYPNFKKGEDKIRPIIKINLGRLCEYKGAVNKTYEGYSFYVNKACVAVVDYSRIIGWDAVQTSTAATETIEDLDDIWETIANGPINTDEETLKRIAKAAKVMHIHGVKNPCSEVMLKDVYSPGLPELKVNSNNKILLL